MKILLLNQTFYPDVVATAQQLSDLAATLVDRGHEVTVVCGRRAYDRPRQLYAARETWRGVEIVRVASFGFGKRARWRRAADFASYFAACTARLAFLPRYDLVVALTSPPLISWIGAAFAKLRGARFAFWSMDLNPDEAIAAGWLAPDTVPSRMLQSMLRYSLRGADVIVALDRYMARRIADKGIEETKIAVLPPWSRDREVRYDVDGRRQFRAAHGLDGKHVVMYSGNHSPCHPLTTLLAAALRLRDRADVVFCFVGGGSEFETVRQYAADHELRNIVTLPYEPADRLSASLSAADLHVVVMGDPFVGIVHPCKVYNIRALGIPFLYIGPAESHVTELGPAFHALHGDVDAVADAVNRSAAGECAPCDSKADSNHSQDVLTARMAELLEAIASPGRASEPTPVQGLTV